MRALLVISLLTLAACKAEPTPAEKAAADARDIAEVEALQRQKPPPRPISPQTIGYPDIARYNLFGPGCAFAPEGGLGAIALTQPKRAIVKLDGVLQQLAADPGSSPKMPFGTHTRYLGKAYAIDLARIGGETGSFRQDETGNIAVRLTITDPYQQVVFSAPGIVQCGS